MNAPSIPEDVTQQLERMQQVISGLESALNPFLGKLTAEIEAELTPFQRAEVHQTLAQAVAALFRLYLKCQGIEPADHAFRKEGPRLKQYQRKVRKAVAEEELRESKPSLEVDVGALSRFIAAAVPDLSAEQKRELKEVGTKNRLDTSGGTADKQGRKRQRKRAGNEKDIALDFLQETLGNVRSS